MYDKETNKKGAHMANVFDTAKYILKNMGELSTMKLQKLCYYSQAWSLVWDDTPLFNEDFEAWANGPVYPELYAEDENGGENNLTDNQKDTINRVIEYYGGHDTQWLSQLTCMEAPWNEARKDIPAGAGCSKIISKESMARYYSGL